MKNISTFDQKLIGIIALIPSHFESPLKWLGRLTTPVLWASYLVTLQYVWLSPGALKDQALFVIILMPLASILKHFFRRKRPPTIYAENMRIKSYSFPSSHAYSATLAGGYLIASTAMSGYVFIPVLLTGLVFMIVISRVRIGAHYPTDVIAGAVMGSVLLWVIINS